MRIVTLLVLICIVSLIFVGQSMYSSDLETNTTRDIYSQTESSFNWSNYSSTIEKTFDSNVDTEIEVKEYNVNVERIKNVLVKFIDFVGYGTFEISKWGIEYGYEHPEHDLGFFLNFLIKLFWIILFIALIPLVIPILAIIYLSVKGIIYLIKKIRGVNGKTRKQRTR